MKCGRRGSYVCQQCAELVCDRINACAMSDPAEGAYVDAPPDICNRDGNPIAELLAVYPLRPVEWLRPVPPNRGHGSGVPLQAVQDAVGHADCRPDTLCALNRPAVTVTVQLSGSNPVATRWTVLCFLDALERSAVAFDRGCRALVVRSTDEQHAIHAE